jgi:ATP-dependent DNA helicase RecQ
VEEAVRRLGAPRERVVKALSWLEETGAIALKPSGLRHAFRLCGDAARRDPAEVSARLAALFLRREERETLRLKQITDFATQPGCITRRLLAHFGEPLPDENCGHCHPCRLAKTGDSAANDTQIELPATRIPPFTSSDVARVRELIAETHPSIATPRQLTRLLCGLTSPATSRAKLTKRPQFGMFDATPFRVVLAWVEGLMAE